MSYTVGILHLLLCFPLCILLSFFCNCEFINKINIYCDCPRGVGYPWEGKMCKIDESGGMSPILLRLFIVTAIFTIQLENN